MVRFNTCVLLVVIVVIGIILFQQQPVSAQTINIFEKPEWGLKIPYPSNWSIGEEEGSPQNGDAFVSFLSPEKKFPHVSVLVSTDISPGLKLQVGDVGKQMIQNAKQQLKNYQLLGDGTITINGKNAYAISYMSQGSRGPQKDLQIVMVENNTMYSFSLVGATSQQEYSNMLPVFQQMITSAELTGIGQGQQQGGSTGGFGQSPGGGFNNQFSQGQQQGFDPFQGQG
jgi:hypothetical protein